MIELDKFFIFLVFCLKEFDGDQLILLEKLVLFLDQINQVSWLFSRYKNWSIF